MERIVITFNPDGSFRGASASDFNGLPAPLDAASLATCFPELNSAALSRVAELEAALAAAPSADEVVAKDVEIAGLRAQLEAALNPPQPEILLTLGEAFKTLIPSEFQGQFGPVFATVRVLVQAGELGLAAATIAATPVPPELEAAKAQFLAFFTTP